MRRENLTRAGVCTLLAGLSLLVHWTLAAFYAGLALHALIRSCQK